MGSFHYDAETLTCDRSKYRRSRRGSERRLRLRATLCDHYDLMAAAFAPLDPILCYSVKSCPNIHLCKMLAQRGAGFDVVSGRAAPPLRAGAIARRSSSQAWENG